MENISVLDFFNHQEYLECYYNARKEIDESFSHREFLKKARINGTAYLQRIISRKQMLSLKYVDNFIKALELDNTESNYFRNLVIFNNSKDSNEKLNALQMLFQIRSQFERYTINDKKLKFLKKWYYPILRELAPLIDFNENYNYLGRMVIPRLNAAQARNGIKYLCENGYLLRLENGKYKQIEPIMSTGDQVYSTLVSNYHQNSIKQAADAVFDIPVNDRDISALVVGVSENSFREIQNEIQQFRKKILSIAEKEKSPDQVCYLGLQWIPKSKRNKVGDQ